MTEHDAAQQPRLTLVAEDGNAPLSAPLRPRLRHGHRPGPDHSGPCEEDTDCADDEICFGGNCT